jgi:tetratricopeptide (TPR) repeat protein
VGLTAQINFETKSGHGGIDVQVRQEEPVYPLFLALYQRNAAGQLTITNRENAEIRNVRVSFRAGNYTSSEFVCGTIPFIARGQGAEIPLYADFSPGILNFTENGRIVGEVVVRYQLLGRQRETVRSGSVQVYNRNMFSTDDMAALAAFVSPSSPEILEYTKYITGAARALRRTGLNQNMQFGMWIFEGLKAYGFQVETNDGQAENAGEVQFPAQTLAYKSGKALDIGLLYAASLEAAGIRAAFIPLDGDFITALSLGINEAAAGMLFNGSDRILVVDDEVWIPLSMKSLNGGFMAAWTAAFAALNEALEAGEMIEFNIFDDSWAMYPPAPFPALGVRIIQPDQGAVNSGASAAINRYIADEIEPLVREAEQAVRNSPSAAGYNRLGLLRMRAGRTAEAKTAFEQAAGMGSVAAMTNRGNAALNERNYTTAERWFRRALAAQPDNTAAIRGLEQSLANSGR